MASRSTEVIQYLVETQDLWPKATKTKDLENEVGVNVLRVSCLVVSAGAC